MAGSAGHNATTERSGHNVTTASTAVDSTQDTGPNLSALLSAHSLYVTATWINKVGLLVVLALGLFGNSMILVIQWRLRQRARGPGGGVSAQIKDSGMSVFVTALAVSDLLMLLTVACTASLYDYGVDLDSAHQVLCKGLFFAMFVLGSTSSWFLVAMTAHRACSIVSPYRASALCSTSKATWCVLAIVIVLLANNAHFLYGRTITVLDSGQDKCGFVSAAYLSFFLEVWYWVDLSLSSFLPFLLLLLSNSSIIYSVSQSLREARLKLAAGTANQLQLQTRRAKASSMNVTLLCASAAFLALTLPFLVLVLVRNAKSADVVPSVDEQAVEYFTEALANLLWVSNNAINFYIYSLTGHRYRTELGRMLGYDRQPHNAVPVPSTVTTVSRSE